MKRWRMLGAVALACLGVSGAAAGTAAAAPNCHITSSTPIVYNHANDLYDPSYGWCGVGVNRMDLYSVVQFYSGGTWYNAPAAYTARGSSGTLYAGHASSEWVCGFGYTFRDADYMVVTVGSATYSYGWQYSPTEYMYAGDPYCEPPLG